MSTSPSCSRFFNRQLGVEAVAGDHGAGDIGSLSVVDFDFIGGEMPAAVGEPGFGDDGAGLGAFHVGNGGIGADHGAVFLPEIGSEAEGHVREGEHAIII